LEVGILAFAGREVFDFLQLSLCGSDGNGFEERIVLTIGLSALHVVVVAVELKDGDALPAQTILEAGLSEVIVEVDPRSEAQPPLWNEEEGGMGRRI
jgi:hypothetical protein